MTINRIIWKARHDGVVLIRQERNKLKEVPCPKHVRSTTIMDLIGMEPDPWVIWKPNGDGGIKYLGVDSEMWSEVTGSKSPVLAKANHNYTGLHLKRAPFHWNPDEYPE